MVKQAEKVRKRNPMLPVYGLILAITLFVVAYLLVSPVSDLARKFSPDFRLSRQEFSITQTENGQTKVTMPGWDRIGVAFAIWLILMALASAVVAMAIGKDPNSAKQIVLPPRTKEEKRKRY
jgi:ribose/xylose/arabinose/galactoside ABC-type transport system permease subunit